MKQLKSPIGILKAINAFMLYALCFMLYALCFSASAQIYVRPPCDIIQNPQFNPVFYNSSYSVDPFNFGCVAPWKPLAYTPQITTVANSATYAATGWSQYMPPPHTITIGESVQQDITGLVPGRPYLFSIMIGNSGSPGTMDSFMVYLTDTISEAYLGSAATDVQFIAKTGPIPASTWFYNLSVCNFIPDKSWKQINLVPKSNGLAWMQWDDVHLIPNYDFAGPDTNFCSPGSVTIGDNCEAYFVTMGLTPTYTWFLNGTAIATTATIEANLIGTNEYVLERVINGCYGYDTVAVFGASSLPFNLGEDTVVCDGKCIIRGVEPDSLATYLWNTGSTSSFISICNSGTYVLNINYLGCITSDTINVVVYPEIKVMPELVEKCDFLPVTFCTTGGYPSYSWSNGLTDSCITVTVPGKYWVTVVDSNGCQKTDTCEWKYKPIGKIDLGNDIDTCANSLTINGPADYSSYYWSTGATTQAITINSFGWYTYILNVQDSGSCIFADTINIRLRKPVSLSGNDSLGIFCLFDNPVSLAGMVIPSGGKYIGPGVSGTTFNPAMAQPGTHAIQYAIGNDTICPDTHTVWVQVKNGPHAEIQPEPTVCPTKPPFALRVQKTVANGTWGGAASASGVFNPATAGPGNHLVTYRVTDTTTGCTFVDSMYIYVAVKYTASATEIVSPNRFSCLGSMIQYQAGAGKKFEWKQISPAPSYIVDTGSVGSLLANGTYRLIVYDSTGNCPDSIDIIINKPNCCTSLPANQPPSQPSPNLIINTNTTWSNKRYLFSQDVIVRNGATLNIIDCDIIFKNCATLLVENNGVLNIIRSTVGTCQWRGIEAGGWLNSCQDRNAQPLIPTCQKVSLVNITNSNITNAEVGVLAGYRWDRSRAGCAVMSKIVSGGAKLNIQNSIFQNNTVDIMFREYDIRDLFRTACNGIWGNQSIIRYNYFNQPKTSGFCGGFLDTIINEHNGTPGLCHIMDFSENSLLFRLPVPPPPPIYYTTGQTLRGTLDFGIPTIIPFQSVYLPTDKNHNWIKIPTPNIISIGINFNSYFNNCAKSKFYK